MWNEDTLFPSTYRDPTWGGWDMDMMPRRSWDMDLTPRRSWDMMRQMERDMMRPMNRMMNDLNRATRRLRREVRDLEAEVTCDQNKFQARLDCCQFKPEEITVRNVGREIMIEGKHEERPDEHGFTSRTFTRRYRLPEDANYDNAKCDLSSDGILTISVPRVAPALTGGEKLLQIQETGKPAFPA